MAKNDPATAEEQAAAAGAPPERIEIDPGPLMDDKIKALDEAEARNAAQGHAKPPLSTEG